MLVQGALIDGNPAGEKYRGKSTPDWSGSFGGTFSLFGNIRVNTQFDYAFGDFYTQNLSGAFRDSHWLIGRNTVETAQIEATLVNPASTGAAGGGAGVDEAHVPLALVRSEQHRGGRLHPLA